LIYQYLGFFLRIRTNLTSLDLFEHFVVYIPLISTSFYCIRIVSCDGMYDLGILSYRNNTGQCKLHLYGCQIYTTSYLTAYIQMVVRDALTFPIIIWLFIRKCQRIL